MLGKWKIFAIEILEIVSCYQHLAGAYHLRQQVLEYDTDHIMILNVAMHKSDNEAFLSATSHRILCI